MMFDVNVISPYGFPDWAATAAKTDVVLNEETYKQLMQQSVEKGRPVIIPSGTFQETSLETLFCKQLASGR